MKISFDMSSLSSTSSTASTVSSLTTNSVREAIIAYARSILPTLPASFYDFVPFMLAGVMALLFTVLLVLLVEDSDEVYPHAPATQSSENPKFRHSKRIIGLAEREKDAESGREDWEAAAWDPRADVDPTSRRNLKQSQNWIAIQNEKITNGNSYRATNKRLLASPPSSASPQSPAFNQPMLSMAKLIMHRHDQSSKRARSSKSPLPPSPPPAGTTSFGTMQYTLKSATVRSDKLALMAFPSSEVSNDPHPRSSLSTTKTPSQPRTFDTEKGISEEARRPSTRHARSRSTVRPSVPNLTLPSFSNVPALAPALQLLQPRSTQEKTVRRSPSSLLEEGNTSEVAQEKSMSLPSTTDESDVIGKCERREKSGFTDLEEGSHQ